MNQVMHHPSREELEAFGLGRLEGVSAAEVQDHLETCDACRGVVASLPDDRLSALIRASATPLEQPTAVTEGISSQRVSESDTPPQNPRYRIIERIGVGGMGVVYKAQHLLMERTVALKVIHRRLTEKPALVERFRREVKAAAGLNHPNIVAAHDADQAGDQQILVMEYVQGITLDRVVKESGPLDPALACTLIRQAALGLQHAHERGLVHRDIKPQNLMVVAGEAATAEPSGSPATDDSPRTKHQVKILDFGLARLGQAAADDLTDPGTIMGTPDFLAPEQADDPRRADIRADIYSLGCTLYFLLTGRSPFPEGNLMQKLKAHALREPQSLTDLCPTLPGGLATVVERMLAKDPAQRYQTPAEVAQALAPYAAGSIPKSPVRSGWHRAWRLMMAGAAALVLIAAVMVYHIQTDQGDIVIETDDPNVQVLIKQDDKLVDILDGKSKQKVTLHTGEYTLILAGDAEGLKVELPPTFVLRRGDKKIITIKRLPPGEITHWQAHNRDTRVALAPDGKILASAGWDGIIKLWKVSDGKELRAWNAHSGTILSLGFSPDGKTLASGSWDHTLKWWDVETGKLRGSIDFKKPGDVYCFSFATDSKALFAADDDNMSKGKLYHVNLETKESKVLTNFDCAARNLILSPDKRTLAVTAFGSPRVFLWDTVTEKEILQFEMENPLPCSVAFHPKDKLLAVGRGEDKGALGLWDLSGKPKVTMEGLKQPVRDVAFSPDGKLLVSGGGVWHSPQGTGEIKVWETHTGKELASLGKNFSCVCRVVVTPNGKTCFTGHGDGNIYKWRLPAAIKN
jgi:WD40 repeat protein/tRNA A-37 threonylcarbamoyl transferase component Bud32